MFDLLVCLNSLVAKFLVSEAVRGRWFSSQTPFKNLITNVDLQKTGPSSMAPVVQECRCQQSIGIFLTFWVLPPPPSTIAGSGVDAPQMMVKFLLQTYFRWQWRELSDKLPSYIMNPRFEFGKANSSLHPYCTVFLSLISFTCSCSSLDIFNFLSVILKCYSHVLFSSVIYLRAEQIQVLTHIARCHIQERRFNFSWVSNLYILDIFKFLVFPSTFLSHELTC